MIKVLTGISKCLCYGGVIYFTYFLKKNSTSILYVHHSIEKLQSDRLVMEMYLSATKISGAALIVSFLLMIMLVLELISAEGRWRVVFGVLLFISVVNFCYALVTTY